MSGSEQTSADRGPFCSSSFVLHTIDRQGTNQFTDGARGGSASVCLCVWYMETGGGGREQVTKEKSVGYSMESVSSFDLFSFSQE